MYLTAIAGAPGAISLVGEDPFAVNERDGTFPPGDTAALDSLERVYGTHASRLKSVAYRLLGNTADAEDAVQEAFVKAFRASGSFREGARLPTWIHRILVNTCLDALRRRKTRGEASPDAFEARAPRRTADHPLRLALEQSLERLPGNQRLAFVLFAVEGLAHAEIAEILEIPAPASRKLLFAARRSLRNALGAGSFGRKK